MPPPLRWPVRAAGLAVVLLLALALPARAHAVLLASDPADGETVEEPITEIVLEFNEPVREPEVAVADPDGEPITDGAPEVDGAVVTQPIERPAARGEHSIAYRVISADDHPVDGELVFTYEGPLPEEDTPTPTPDREPTPAETPTPTPTPDEAETPTPEPADTPVGDLAAARGDDGPPLGLLALGLLVVAAGVAAWAFRRRAGGVVGEAGAEDA